MKTKYSIIACITGLIFASILFAAALSQWTTNAGALADGDFIATTDVSNVTQSANGTSSKMTWLNFKASIKTYTDTLYAAVLGADDNYVTDAEKTVIGNTSNTNSGDNAANTTYAIGSNTQAWSAVLDKYAGVDPSANILSFLGAANYQDAVELLESSDWDWTGTNSMGPLTFTSTATPPAADGAFRYLSGITGLTSKAFSFYSTAVQYMLSYDTLPTVNGSMPTYNATNDDFDWTVPAGSTVASSAEVNIGTDNAKFISPDALAGSNAFTKDTGWTIYDSDVDTAVADGKQYFLVPQSWNGMNLTYFIAGFTTAGVTGTTDIQIRRVRGVTAVDMLSTGATIDTTELDTTTAATPYVIDTANDDLATGDKLFIDVNGIASTAGIGLSGTIEARLP